jgi:hypothetical protein
MKSVKDTADQYSRIGVGALYHEGYLRPGSHFAFTRTHKGKIVSMAARAEENCLLLAVGSSAASTWRHLPGAGGQADLDRLSLRRTEAMVHLPHSWLLAPCGYPLRTGGVCVPTLPSTGLRDPAIAR